MAVPAHFTGLPEQQADNLLEAFISKPNFELMLTGFVGTTLVPQDPLTLLRVSRLIYRHWVHQVRDLIFITEEVG